MTTAAFDPLLALEKLQEHRVRFIVIGGFACRIWGSPTITNDLDICYERSKANREALVAALRELGATARGTDPSVPFLLDEQTIGLGDSFTFETSAGNLDCLGTPAGTSGNAATSAAMARALNAVSAGRALRLSQSAAASKGQLSASAAIKARCRRRCA